MIPWVSTILRTWPVSGSWAARSQPGPVPSRSNMMTSPSPRSSGWAGGGGAAGCLSEAPSHRAPAIPPKTIATAIITEEATTSATRRRARCRSRGGTVKPWGASAARSTRRSRISVSFIGQLPASFGARSCLGTPGISRPRADIAWALEM